MLKTHSFAWIACLLILTSPPEVSAGEELDANKCIDAFHASLRSVQSYDVYVEATEGGDSDEQPDRVRPRRTVESNRQVFDAKGRHRYERFDTQTGATQFAQAHDGVRLVTLSTDRMLAVIYAAGRKYPLPFEAPTANYATTFRQLLDETDIPELLRKRSCRAIRSGGAVMIECLPDPECDWFPKAGWRFFFLQRPAMLLRRIEYYHLEMTKPRLTTEILEFYKVDDDLWMPGRVRHTAYAPNGRKLQHYELKVDRSRSTWNQELPKDVFQVEFPAGTKVIRRDLNQRRPWFPIIDPREQVKLLEPVEAEKPAP